jgi:hypothetical protein
METYSWIILRVRRQADALWLHYEDSRGVRLRPSFSARRVSKPWFRHTVTAPPRADATAGGALHIHEDFDYHFGKLLDGLPPYQTGPHANGPVPLAVFVEPPVVADDARRWDAFVEELLASRVPPDRFQIVHLSRGKFVRERTAFELPLRVLAIGECAASLGDLRHSRWYEENPAVQQHGIVLEASERYFDLKEPWDIVLAGQSSVEHVLARAGGSETPPAHRPRLVIFLGHEWHEAFVPGFNPPPGVAFLWLPLLTEGCYFHREVHDFVKRFFYGIVHDYPLHEALKSATREGVIRTCITRPPVLLADPSSNNSLRLSDALDMLRREANQLRDWSELGRLGRFVERTGQDLNANLRERLLNLREPRAMIRGAVENIHRADILFDQESFGIVPMSLAAESLTRALSADEYVRGAVSAIALDPDFIEQIGRHQQRKVDVALERRGSARSNYEAVTPYRPLTAGEIYRVRLHVGHRSPGSIMFGDPPPVDPLLPDTEDGHRLEVALFGKDFELLSEGVQPLYLPRLGGSEPVYFEIRAPRRASVAEARIGVYYQNNILQSFLLKANVTPDGEGRGEPLTVKLFVAADEREGDGGRWVETVTDSQVFVHLAFSQTARFANLDEMERRDLSVGVNENAGGSHTFMLKLDGNARPVQLPEKLLDEQINDFREILKSNLQKTGRTPLFETYPSSGSEAAADFQRVARKLIERGSELHSALFGPQVSKELKKELRELAAESDKTIQIIRHDPNYAFPWPIVYDFPLPTKIHGAPEPTVCVGTDDGGVAPADDAARYPFKRCSHGPDDEVYCVYGFWGLRHRIEQLVETSSQERDAIKDIKPSTLQSCVRVAAMTGDPNAKKLVEKMSEELGSAFVETTPVDNLVDLLWDDGKRPAVLVVIGHMSISNVVGEPEEPRIVLQPKERWFLASDIIKRVKKTEEWKPPNTLVLLMACSGGAVELTTLTDYVKNLTSAGAAAVASTECLVYSSLAARFAHEVTSDLWNKQTLGDAVKFFNRRLVGGGNPLAFTFNCLGNADIKLILPPAQTSN